MHVIVCLDLVPGVVILDITDPRVLLSATVTVAGPPQPVSVTLDTVTGVVNLDITETCVTIDAAVSVLDLPKPVTVSMEPVISVIRGFMEGSAQISVV